MISMMPIALVAMLAMCASMTASARHSHHPSAAAPGDFDYYVLSLSWSPAFCLQSPNAAQCNGPRHYGFIVHGLWPQNEHGWPQDCAGGQVPDSVAQGVADLMPARNLVNHEWSAHGSCSGLDPARYFSLVRHAYASVTLPPSFSQPGGPLERPPSSIAAEFLRLNPNLPPQSAVVTCSGQATPRLREVHLCFGRDLTPRACSADEQRQACRAPSVIVPPIR